MKPTLTKRKFLEWCLEEGGYDYETLGRQVFNDVYLNGKSTITPRKLLNWYGSISSEIVENSYGDVEEYEPNEITLID